MSENTAETTDADTAPASTKAASAKGKKGAAPKKAAAPKAPRQAAAAPEPETGGQDDLIKITVAPRTQEWCRKTKRFAKPGEEAWVPKASRAKLKAGSAPAPHSDVEGESELDDDPIVRARSQRPKTSQRARAAKG